MGHPFPPERLSQANLSPRTGLATDYLNHFNEVAMMIGMLAELPEAAEEVLAWEPCSYLEHFRRSGFRDRELAQAAYEAADPLVLAGFEAERQVVESLIREMQRRIADEVEFAAVAKSSAAALYEAISALGAIITGEDDHAAPPAGCAVDALFAANLQV